MKIYKPGEAPDGYSIEEYCPWCDSCIPIKLEYPEDEKGKISYHQTCPVCGEDLMLCTTCNDDRNSCDWDLLDGCKFMK